MNEEREERETKVANRESEGMGGRLGTGVGGEGARKGVGIGEG